MPDYDYSVLYEPMLQQFQYFVDVMLQALPVWLLDDVDDMFSEEEVGIIYGIL